MKIRIREFCDKDTFAAISIWNNVVEEGRAFPQLDKLTVETGRDFFAEQTYTGVAEDMETKMVLGLYILHPNNIGRCGHIATASYAVAGASRGCGIGELLVRDSLRQAKMCGFRIMQFNAVVSTNKCALGLYRRIGFVQLGTIPKGFLQKDGTYQDIIPHYYEL